MRLARLKVFFERQLDAVKAGGDGEPALQTLESIRRLQLDESFVSEGRRRLGEVYLEQAGHAERRGLRGEMQQYRELACEVWPACRDAFVQTQDQGLVTQSGLPLVSGMEPATAQRLQQEAAERLGKPVFFSDGESLPELAVIPAGSFFMGAPEDEYARDDSEGPQHKVSFYAPFAISRHAVTYAMYARFCEAVGYSLPRRYFWTYGQMPVINVTWADACEYAAWLSSISGHRYRLPTEAEWEYAARAGSESAFAFGDKIHRSEVNCSGGLHCTRGLWFCGPGKPVEVGALPANVWGLFEVHGNVQEFVQDAWRDSYHGIPREGSLAHADSHTVLRVVRGGSWFDKPGQCRSASRRYRAKDEFDLNLGFRLVREFSAEELSSEE